MGIDAPHGTRQGFDPATRIEESVDSSGLLHLDKIHYRLHTFRIESCEHTWNSTFGAARVSRFGEKLLSDERTTTQRMRDHFDQCFYNCCHVSASCESCSSSAPVVPSPHRRLFVTFGAEATVDVITRVCEIHHSRSSLESSSHDHTDSCVIISVSVLPVCGSEWNELFVDPQNPTPSELVACYHRVANLFTCASE